MRKRGNDDTSAGNEATACDKNPGHKRRGNPGAPLQRDLWPLPAREQNGGGPDRQERAAATRQHAVDNVPQTAPTPGGLALRDHQIKTVEHTRSGWMRCHRW